MGCAGCACEVEDGVRVVECGDEACCCLDAPASTDADDGSPDRS